MAYFLKRSRGQNSREVGGEVLAVELGLAAAQRRFEALDRPHEGVDRRGAEVEVAVNLEGAEELGEVEPRPHEGDVVGRRGAARVGLAAVVLPQTDDANVVVAAMIERRQTAARACVLVQPDLGCRRTVGVVRLSPRRNVAVGFARR